MKYLVFTIGVLSSLLTAQVPGGHSTKGLQVPIETLKISNQVKVPFVTPVAIFMPFRCTSDGTVFARFGNSFPSQQLISITAKGLSTEFSVSQMYDVPSPRINSFFVTDSAVYVLALGLENPRQSKMKGVDSSGHEHEFQQLTGKSHYYIAKFDHDGTYSGATKLDVDFQPIQFGVFPSGSFLVAGRNPDTLELKVALVKASGQLVRLLELQDDLSEDSEEVKKQAERGGESAKDLINRVGSNSEIVQDGEYLLLLRRETRAPVFRIGASGAVSSIPLKVEGEYIPWSLIPDRKRWVVQAIKRLEESHGIATKMFVVDPNTGDLLNELLVPSPIGIGFACVTDGIYEFLTKEPDGSSKLTLMEPSTSPDLLDVKKPLESEPGELPKH